jgi:serpin B
MASVLAGGIGAETYHSGMNRLARELASRALDQPAKSGNPQRIELNLADAVYVDNALGLQADFLNELSRNYDSGVHREDFQHAFEPARMHINDWVADKTHDKIQDLLPAGSLSDSTRLVLVNALYFYGSWNSAFSPSSTSDAEFHALDGKTVSVPTMHKELGLRHATGTGFAAVELPYVGGHLHMTVVLPDAGQLETVRKAVSGDWLAKLHASATSKAVRVALPKFKLTTSSFSLTNSLKAMGMNTPFTDKADFTGITSDQALQISDVIQKAFIADDENGTEAAAATAATVTATSAIADVIDFTVDRPFLFFIEDDNGIVLFSGHIVNPA